jgi:hypothetical protein
VTDEAANARWRDVEQLVAAAESRSTRMQRQLSRFRIRARRGLTGLVGAAVASARKR